MQHIEEDGHNQFEIETKSTRKSEFTISVTLVVSFFKFCSLVEYETICNNFYHYIIIIVILYFLFVSWFKTRLIQ